MNIVFAAGGTGGHINPAIAIAQEFEKSQTCKISFIGNKNGMEADLIPKAGYDFYTINAKGFSRKKSVSGVKHNLKALRLLIKSSKQSKQYLKQLKPDIVIGTGGYVCAPVIRAAIKLGIPTALHESNAYPGVAVKMLSSKTDLIMISTASARKYLPNAKKVVVTGNPVRADIKNSSKERSRDILKLDNRFMILSFGGSLGAKRFNEVMVDVIDYFKQKNIYLIHSTGDSDYLTVCDKLKAKGYTQNANKNVMVNKYIHNMQNCLSAADLVICRAGAITISELQATAKASILVPSPNVTDNHQYYNAKALADIDCAILIEEKDLSSKSLIKEIEHLMQNPENIKKLEQNNKKHYIDNTGDRIYIEIMQLLKTNNNV